MFKNKMQEMEEIRGQRNNNPITIYKAIDEFLKIHLFFFPRDELKLFCSFVDTYLDITYDRVKNSNEYDMFSGNFICLETGLYKIEYVINEIHETLNNESFSNYRTSIIFECIHNLTALMMICGASFFWKFLELYKQIYKKEKLEYNPLKMAWIDFCINVTSQTRNDTWEVKVIQKWYYQHMNKDLKKVIKQNEWKNIFNFYTKDRIQYATLIDIEHKTKYIIQKLKRIKSLVASYKIDEDVFQKTLKMVEKKLAIKISIKQRETISKAISSLTIVNGKAGTGKTLVITCIALYYSLLKRKKVRCMVLSFTGKAVSLLNEKLIELGINSKKIEARTIHREIAKIVEKKIKEETVYILDESSMVSTNLLYRLFRRANIRNISFFGDINQLPPIQLGCPFVSFIKTNPLIFKKITLKTYFREKNRNGDLINFKECILLNAAPLKKVPFKKSTGTGISIVEKSKLEGVLKNLSSLYHKEFRSELEKANLEHNDSRNHLINLNKKRIYLASRNHLVNSLNNMIHARLLSSSKNTLGHLPLHSYNREQIDFWGNSIPICVGTKLIFKGKNIYRDKMLYIANGETCIVSDIKTIENYKYTKCIIHVLFNNNKEQIYSFEYSMEKAPNKKNRITLNRKNREINLLLNLELAYVLTIHKAQGSEYDHVTTIFNTRDDNLLSWWKNDKGNSFYSKNLLYTAISRAKISSHLIVPTQEFIDKCLKIEATNLNSFMTYLLEKE